jgi:integrase
VARGDQYNLRRRGEAGYWVADFVLYGVRVHRSTKCTIKDDAVDRCDGWAKAIRDKHDGIPSKEPAPTLKKALEEWETANTGVLSEKHIKVTVDKIRLNFADLLEVPIDELDTTRVETIRTAYLTNPGPTGRIHKPGGANSLIMALNTVMGWASHRWEVPARPYHLRKVKQKRVPRRVVPIQDTPAFLAAVDAPYEPSNHPNSPKAKPKNPHVCLAIRMMLGLGLREKEALSSRWEWFDWKNRTYYAGETKNGEVRLIPVPRWLQKPLEKSKPKPCMGLIMPGEDGSPHVGQFTKKVLNLVGRQLGLTGLTPHRLRATFATNHARAGTDIRKIQVWLDHANIETTMLYIEYVDEGSHAAQDRVEELMGFPTDRHRPRTPRTSDLGHRLSPKKPLEKPVKRART